MRKQIHRQPWLCTLLTAALYFVVCDVHASALAPPASTEEFELRAAVVIGIIRFASQYDHEGVEYPLCLVGAPPSGEKLAQGKGTTISKNRKLAILTVDPSTLMTSCAAIVMGPKLSAEQQAGVAQQAIRNSSILICDECSDDTLAHVTLRRKGERIVFVVDIALAQQSQISFSSKLLSLAIETRPSQLTKP